MCIHIYSGMNICVYIYIAAKHSSTTSLPFRRTGYGDAVLEPQGPPASFQNTFPALLTLSAPKSGSFPAPYRSEQLKGIQGLSPASQGRNATSTVVHVPYSLDSGTGVPRS